MKTNNVTFCAKYKDFRYIGKLNPLDRSYAQQVRMSFVEINPLDSADVSALEYIAKYWKNDKFASNISVTANAILNDKKTEGIKIFALTSQADTFEKINPDKILGVVEIQDMGKNIAHINRFQVMPEYVYNTEPEYKGIGTAISDSLKLYYTKITAISESLKSVKNFYERNGYIELIKGSNFYVWYKDLFGKI